MRDFLILACTCKDHTCCCLLASQCFLVRKTFSAVLAAWYFSGSAFVQYRYNKTLGQSRKAFALCPSVQREALAV